VAVNIFPDVDLVKDYDFGHSVSGWQVLARFLNPFKKNVQVPGMFENLVRVIALNGVQQARARRELADVYIRPEVERFNILDFPAYKEIIELGYQAGRVEIAQWLKRPAPIPVTAQSQPTVAELAQTLSELELVLEQFEPGPARALPA
jgi:predicted acylesterase/phospholipase RssA